MIKSKTTMMLLTAGLLLSSCSENKKVGQKAPTRVKMQIVSPAMADGSQTYVGIIEEREATAVSFTGMGVVKRMLVSEGQAVSRGQLIAEMDDTQARNLLSGAEAQMTQANDALERYKMLHDNGSLPEVQWVEIQSKVAQAKSQLEVAKKNLADCRLTAPQRYHRQEADWCRRDGPTLAGCRHNSRCQQRESEGVCARGRHQRHSSRHTFHHQR